MVMRYCVRYALLTSGLFASALISPIHAQSGASVPSRTASSLHLATLIGVVIDSIHLGPLVGATVLLDGTTLSAATNAHGQFRIDSIPPGTYRVAVFHPMLDTLGFLVGSPALRMGADSIRDVALATPSASTLVSAACPDAERRLGPGAILGRVLDPDTHAPLDSARVSLVWTGVSVGKTIGVNRRFNVRNATSGPTGAFAICGIPLGVHGTIRADRGRAETAEVPVAFDESPVVLQSLTLSTIAATDTVKLTGRALLTGRVTDTLGEGISDADITVQGARATARSAKDGRFRLSDLPSGTRAVLVRRVGFSPGEAPVWLSAATPATVTVRLAKPPPALAPVLVQTSTDAPLDKNGFTGRRLSGMGYYLGPSEIERRQPQALSQLFPMIPGFRIVPGVGTGMAIKSVRDGCVTYWVDGVPTRESQAGEMDYQVRPDELLAIEAYSAAAAPLEYKQSGSSSCAVVLIWTKRNVAG
jgi:hypothetical protein